MNWPGLLDSERCGTGRQGRFDHARSRALNLCHAIRSSGQTEIAGQHGDGEQGKEHAFVAEQHVDMRQAGDDSCGKYEVKVSPTPVGQVHSEGCRQAKHQQQQSCPAKPQRPRLRTGVECLPGKVWGL